MLLEKTNLNTIEVLMSKASIDSYMSRELKKEIKNPETSVKHTI